MERVITILQDTREQQPLKFEDDKWIKGAIRQKLDFGDYGGYINSYQLPVVFERKSLTDLYGTLTQGWERFKREIERSKSQSFAFVIVIEASIKEARCGVGYSQRTPESLFYQLCYSSRKYGFWFHFCNDRQEAAFFIQQILIGYAKVYLNGSKSKTNLS